MRIVGVAVLLLFASCVRTSTVTCGDVTCQAGSVCSPSGTACTTQLQIDACRDADTPATTCTAPGGRDGVCRDGYCQEIRCGDLRVDPGEMCDDGNFAAGDACSPDCLSDESCGNGVLDRGLEECDDGNPGAHDGCNATCRTESPIWRQLIDTSFPPRDSHAMVYDVARKRIVLFGGRTGLALSNETWEFDGLGWTLRTPATPPPAREHASLAYDPIRQRTVLFGGSTGPAPSDLLGDTWEWDGTNWSQKLLTGPSPRSGANVVFHPGRSVVVLYGGGTAGSTVSDTWEYNGTAWILQSGAGGPSKSALQPMSYDPVVGGVVAFGHDGTTETWKYNGTWTLLTVSGTLPRGRSSFAMTFDASTNHTVLIGGLCGTDTLCSDAFELVENGGAPGTYFWVNVSAGYAPLDGAAAYDDDTSQLVVMGGKLPGTNFKPEAATWMRTAGTWTRLELPSPRIDCQLAYLPALGGTVLFGGSDTGSTGRADTWLLRDGLWRPLHPTISPAPTSSDAMVLDRARNKLVLIDALGDTWELGASGWTMIATASRPALRQEYGLVYDEARAAVVLYGGYEPIAKVFYTDTWTYNGTNWTQLATATAPSARRGFAMSYDRARDRVVLFGGSTGAAADDKTWELSGTTWTQTTAMGPTARSATAMVFDPKRASSVMFGGRTAANTPSNETWEYVDAAWRLSATVAPSARASYCSTYDETLEKVVVVGGSTTTGAPVSETWLFGYE